MGLSSRIESHINFYLFYSIDFQRNWTVEVVLLRLFNGEDLDFKDFLVCENFKVTLFRNSLI